MIDERAETTQLSPTVRDVPPDKDTLRLLHQTIAKVTDDLDGMRFNTAIAAMMEFSNHLTRLTVRPKTVLQTLVLLLSPRDAFLSRVSNPRLRNIITQLFRRNARVGSGSAMDAFRFEQRTGILLSPSGHGLKLFERRSQLQRLRRELSLFSADRQVVKELLIDIQNALSGQ